jgi:hypothetical protein
MPNSNNNSNPSVLGIVAGTTLVVGALSSLGWYYYFTTAFQNHHKTDDEDERPSQDGAENRDSSLIKPPFPQTLRDMLSKCRLAYLSTVHTMAKSSHLSLMRFTYVHDPEDGEVIIMSTNKKTKKFEMLRQQRGVALLVHDFDKAQSDDGDGSSSINSNSNSNVAPSTRSITLNGNCRILSGPDEERYRKAHLAHNPEYPQFIVGEDIAVLCIDCTSARICDLNDKVVHWNIMDGGAN